MAHSLPSRSDGLRLPLRPAPIAFLAILGIATAVAVVDPLAGALVVMTPLIPFLIYGVMRGIVGDRTYGLLLAVMIILGQCATFRFREYGDKSIDAQIMMRLAALAGGVGLGVLYLRPILYRLKSQVLTSWLVFYGVLVFSSSYSFVPSHAAVASISILASFLFVCMVCVRHGPDRLVDVLVWSGLAMCIASLAVYVAVPEFGRLATWEGDDFVLTSRLQGVFGAPNGAGSVAGALIFLTAVFYMGRPDASRPIGYATLITALLCLLLSNNRMALACLILSSLLYYMLSGQFGRKLVFLVSLGILLILPVLLFPEEIFGLLSRTGDADEISSGTGRSRIWAVVLDMIPKSWVFGYGYASAIHVLSTHPDLFAAAAHCHNLYLEVMFGSGIIGFAALVWSIVTSFVLAIRIGAARELALFFYFLPYGLTEPVVGGSTFLGLFIWQAAIVLMIHRKKQIEGARLAVPSLR